MEESQYRQSPEVTNNQHTGSKWATPLSGMLYLADAITSGTLQLSSKDGHLKEEKTLIYNLLELHISLSEYVIYKSPYMA